MKVIIFLFATFLTFNLFAQSFKVDEQMGGEAAEQIAATMGIYQDSNLTKYVNAIGQRLVKQLGEQPFTYEFHILDMKEPNAFALPGGYVYVSRGILALTNSEAELAGILGHEIIHVHRRHSVQQVKKSVFPGLMQLPGIFVGAVVDERLGAVLNAPAAVSAGLLMGKYSRSSETEADEMGAALAAKAGYNPKSLSDILGNLHQEIEALTGEEETFSYFDSHPYTPNRVKNLETLIEKGKLSKPESKPPFLNDSAYASLIAGIPLDDNPQNGLVAHHVFYHKDLDLSFKLDADWMWQNTPTAFQAVRPDGTLNLMVQAISDTLTPKELGHRKRNELFNTHGLKPAQSQLVELSGKAGYLLVYQEKIGEIPVKAYSFWWQSTESTVIKFTAMAKEEVANEVWNTITSVSSISDSALTHVTYPVLAFVQANENEKLQDIIARNGHNVLSMSMLSALNGNDFGFVYQKGAHVKIGVSKPLGTPEAN